MLNPLNIILPFLFAKPKPAATPPEKHHFQEDAQTLLAPVLDRCDLDCPCVECTEDGERSVRRAMVKGCETRKALKRLGLAEVGLSMERPYQYIVADKGRAGK